ncbi:MAG: HAMP domain-containing histidine kinase [Muribaculaceae bacterium]|nr:HAMP domain-containing histidine kinase [Muribaculaceae bacterium]
MANIYELRRYGKIAFLTTSAAVVAMFLFFSDALIRDLSTVERERMQLWADATKQLVTGTMAMAEGDDQATAADVDFLLGIIRGNTTIPVLLTDDEGNILTHRNFKLPEPGDTLGFGPPDHPANIEFLRAKLESLAQSPNVIDIEISPDEVQHLYYEDSTLLRRMSIFPYIQVLVMLAFIAVVYFAVLSTKKAEQNKVWVGLSKETAHQLGTPISSLMAWMELLPDMGVDREVITEMNKDVNRLSTIASRFSKIGSDPRMLPAELNDTVGEAVAYMSTRISPRIKLLWHPAAAPIGVEACTPLLAWVIENLIKNAVDAMEGSGRIDVSVGGGPINAYVEVSDTGKGISRKNFKNVFNAGYTTKSRGWGLGLTLAKRIVEQYHGGRIFVKQSSPGQGTTFRIELPARPAALLNISKQA